MKRSQPLTCFTIVGTDEADRLRASYDRTGLQQLAEILSTTELRHTAAANRHNDGALPLLHRPQLRMFTNETFGTRPPLTLRRGSKRLARSGRAGLCLSD